MRIEFSKSAAKLLQRLEKNLRAMLHSAIDGLTLQPPKGDIKPMQGKYKGYYRLRVGGYRVIYRYDKDGAMVILYIAEIGTRGDVYK